LPAQLSAMTPAQRQVLLADPSTPEWVKARIRQLGN
jgi:hypothetical protein